MLNQKTFQGCLGVLVLLVAFSSAWTQEQSAAPQSPADNSKVNQQDRSPSEPTADQQKNGHSDLDVTREIRRSLTKDSSLSTYAHNIKVITQNGKVTLKGPVRSQEEKSSRSL